MFGRDIAAASKENRVLSPLQTYKAHKSSVSVSHLICFLIDSDFY